MNGATSSLLTVESALQANGRDTSAALEAVIHERNSLTSQNAQLWKLIEKQRAMYNSATKEIDKLRALLAQSTSTPPVASKEKEPHTASEKTSIDASTASATSKRPDRPERAEARDKPPREKLSRSNSEDQYAQKYLGTSDRTLSPSRSHEPLNGSPLRTTTTTASIQPEAVTPVTGSNTQQKPSRGESLPTPAAITPLTVQKKASLPAPSTKSHNAPIPPVPVIVSEDVSSSSKPTLLTQSPSSTSSTPSQPPAIPPMLYPSSSSGEMLLTAPAPRDRRGARESRITLPDEAARYIAAMGESPSGSPKPQLSEFGGAIKGGDPNETVRADKKNGQPDVANETEPYSIENSPVEEEVSYPVVSNERKAPNYPPPPPPGTASSTSTVREVHKQTGSRNSSVDYNDATTPMPTQTSYGHQHQSPKQWQPPTKPSVHSPDSNDSTPVLGGFDRPSFAHQQSSGSISTPSPNESEPPTSAQSSTYQSKYSDTKERRDTRDRHTPQQQHSQLAYNDPQFYDTGATSSSQSKSAKSPATATPQHTASKSTQPQLLQQDLPATRIHIAGSQIRSNERGKEVLSFIIGVHLVRIGSSAGSEEWKVEKMYSDILALDGKVRAALGRSQAKRLPPLPDAKLFKDNAPAKVDQRRVILEQYLQALLVVPIKDTSDICQFFSSDLSRGDRAPLASQGYKEGYLTKRGKNFGGWRTRYFVLQNSVLEYFENRGGAHLGTINITGAQIGRQQRQANADDENAYRHAFLIIEQTKKGAVPSRHVLCAASDTERDDWVDVLVRSIAPSYGDDSYHQSDTTSSSAATSRPSTSSNAPSERPGAGNSPVDRPSGQSQAWTDAQLAQRMIERGNQGGTPTMSTAPLPNSLPSSLESSGMNAYNQPRSDSSMGHQGESSREQRTTLQPSSHHEPTSKSRSDKSSRTSHHPSVSTLKSSHASTSSGVDRGDDSSAGESTTAGSVMSGTSKKISGPLNAQPILPGQAFGSKAADTSDRDRKAKSGRFWPNFGKSSNASGSDRPAHPSGSAQSAANGQPGRMVFGVPLENALAVAQIANLPAIIFRCIEYLEAKKAAEEEGIYRLNGSSAVIKSLKDRFNYEGDVDLLKHDEFWDPHAIAGLLKQFLRDMPTTILTRELQQHFLSVVDLMDPKERTNELAHLVSQLPVSNYCLLRAMTAHLILIVQNSNVNKMTMRNIGIVFSPTLGIPAGILSLMLGEFDHVFNVDPTDASSDVASSNEHESYESQNERTPQKSGSSSRATQRSNNNSHERINKRNSMLYANTATDRMLGLSGRKLEPSTEDSSDGDEVSIPEEESDEETDRDDISSRQTPLEQTGSGSPPSPAPQISISSADPQMHGAKAIAANRGLQISVNGKKMHRSSGLPSSPRPVRYPGSPGLSGPSGNV